MIEGGISMGIYEIMQKLCGGSNNYTSMKIACKPDGELTITIRTNKQEIINGNEKVELGGYMFGKWLMKQTNVFFVNGMFKALKEGLS